MKVHQLQDGRLLLQGSGLQLSASSPPVDIRNQYDLLKIEAKWQDVLVPDLELLNSYLPGNPPFL